MFNPILRIKVNCNPESEDSLDLLAMLQTSTRYSSMIKGGIIIDPFIDVAEPYIENKCDYIIPEEIENKKYTILIDIVEGGGWQGPDDPNLAQVVCGMSGKALKPYFIPRLNVEQCGRHAYFSVPEGCVVIQASNEEIIIREVKIEAYPTHATLVETDYFAGNLNNLPTDLVRFKLAAEIAVDKSNCEKCTHVHYYVDTNQIITKPKKKS